MWTPDANRARWTALVAVIGLSLTGTGEVRLNPFSFLAPDVVVAGEARVRLDANESVVEVQPGRDGFLSLSAIVRIDATSDRLAAWASQVEALQKGKYVVEIGRFSEPPRVEDLQGLTIDPGELDDLRRCQPGNCQVKLADHEIAIVRATVDRRAADAAFRRVLVDRAAGYLRSGDHEGLPYHDHKQPVHPAASFAALVERAPFFSTHFGCYDRYLRSYPVHPPTPEVRESFLYWSKEALGMKPIISITHFSLARFTEPGMPAVLIIAKQVYASHYKNASFTMTALTGDGTSRYLVYVNRAHVDAFRGLFGGMVRRTVERRVKAEAPGVLRGLRQRLESGDPPGSPVTPGESRFR